jgi:xylose isomerase
MQLKHSIIVGILGRYADRFHEYQPARIFEENLKVAASLPGIQGVEIVYPQDFVNEQATVNLIKEIGLPVSAVNLNIKTEPKWKYGSFTNPDPKIRAEAVSYMKSAMDLAAELGTDMITCCPLIDGWDYNFQVDYQNQWKWLIEGLREAASHRSDIKVSLEYKPYETRNTIILPNVSTTLHACNQVGLPNVGVTMDVGHALGAKETPAQSACLANDAGRLFYVHFNDNNRQWDWDMLPGSVNPWDVVETLFYLDRMKWNGWFTYDVYTRHGDPAEAFAATLRIMNHFEELVEKIGRKEIQAMIDEGNAARAFDLLISRLVR